MGLLSIWQNVMAECNGLMGMMKQSLPWLYWSWCYAHRLELACKDAFSSPLYSITRNVTSFVLYLRKVPQKVKRIGMHS